MDMIHKRWQWLSTKRRPSVMNQKLIAKFRGARDLSKFRVLGGILHLIFPVLIQPNAPRLSTLFCLSPSTTNAHASRNTLRCAKLMADCQVIPERSSWRMRAQRWSVTGAEHEHNHQHVAVPDTEWLPVCDKQQSDEDNDVTPSASTAVTTKAPTPSEPAKPKSKVVRGRRGHRNRKGKDKAPRQDLESKSAERERFIACKVTCVICACCWR